MSDTTSAQNDLSEGMVEFENPLNGEISLIKAEDIKEWELKTARRVAFIRSLTSSESSRRPGRMGQVCKSYHRASLLTW